jgi:hypothetical protein
MRINCISILEILLTLKTDSLIFYYYPKKEKIDIKHDNASTIISHAVLKKSVRNITPFTLHATRLEVCVNVQGGSNMTGKNCDLFTHKSSRSYLNHLVYEMARTLKAQQKDKNKTLTKTLSIGNTRVSVSPWIRTSSGLTMILSIISDRVVNSIPASVFLSLSATKL